MHSAFCQHLNQHRDRITVSAFIWPSGSWRYLQFCRNLNDPHSSKSQECHKILSISVSPTLPIMVTRNVSLNVSSLNRVPCSERCVHFAASLFEPWKPAKNLLGQKLLRVSSVSGNIAVKLLQATFPLKWLNMLDKVFKNHWQCITELAIKKGIHREQTSVRAGTWRRGVSETGFHPGGRGWLWPLEVSALTAVGAAGQKNKDKSPPKVDI